MSETTDVALSAGAKTLLVLEAALTHGRFTDIVEQTGFAKATTHRILASLVQLGYLTTDRSGSYEPGAKMLLLGGRALAGVDISHAASAVVDHLATETGCTVHVALRSDDSVVYILRRDSNKPYRMQSTVGSSLPMYMSALGKAVLSTLPEEEVRAHAGRTGLRPRTRNTITGIDALLADLALTRERGYALDDEENDPGVRCVASTIRDRWGDVAYALSVSTLSLEHDLEDLRKMAPAVITACARISANLGHAAL